MLKSIFQFRDVVFGEGKDSKWISESEACLVELRVSSETLFLWLILRSFYFEFEEDHKRQPSDLWRHVIAVLGDS